MREFNKRPTRLHILAGFFARGLGILALFVIAIIAVKSAWSMYERFSQALDADQVSKQELAALKNQEAQVGSVVSSLSTDRGIEAQVRERYGVAKPGEGEIIVIRDSASTTEAGSQKGENPLTRFFRAFFVW